MRILAIASKGGHWIQLLRITKAFTDTETTYVSTNSNLAETVEGHRFYTVPDGNRNSILRLSHTFFLMIKIIRKTKPDTIITTGSAPALMGIIAGSLTGKKTIWIDSIANVERVSMSGRIAHYFANRVYTQWPNLANSKFIFRGNILS